MTDRLAAKSTVRPANRDRQRGSSAPSLIQAGRPKGFLGNSRQPAQRATALVPANPAWANYPDPVVKAYEALHPRSALKRLSAREQSWIWAHLREFAEHKESQRRAARKSMKDRSHKSRFPQRLERVARVALDALNLAMEVEEVLREDHGEALNRRLRSSQHLPAFLFHFSRAFSPVYSFGVTRSQREHALIDFPLIYAGHFIRLKTGAWHDEQVAHLLQTIRPEEDDFCANSICRKRNRFKQEHPVLYEYALRSVLKWDHAPTSFWDEVAAGVPFGEKPMS